MNAPIFTTRFPRPSRVAARRICSILLACVTLAISASVLARVDPASQQLRDQQQAMRQLEQQQRLERWQRERPTESAGNHGAARVEPEQHCWTISGVRLAGNRILDTQRLEPTVRTLTSSCMGVVAIDRLLKHLTQRYVEAGYPTSRPYVARAPQHGEPLDIVIVEGFIESIELAGADLPLSLQGAFPGMLGHPLHLPDLEQGLDQLNRLRAYDLQMALLPGEMQGGTRVVLEPRRVASRAHLDALLDNRGGELTGRHRLNLGIGLDSPLGLNGDLRLSLNSVVFDAPGQSEGASLYYSIPYGRWTFTLNASQMRYQAPIPNTRYASSGRSEFYSLGAERVLWRGQQGMLSASVRVDRKQLLNRFGPAVLALQSPTLATLETGLNLLWLEGGLWHASLGVSQGVHWFGADRPFTHKQAPRPDFTKYRANLLHLRQGPVQWPWRWQSELALQYSAHVLPAVEQMQLSDHSAVRGFRQHNVAGASAAAWRNTFSQPLPLPVSLRPSLGVDLGWARYARTSEPQRLVGASAGIELNLPHSTLRLDYQRALHASDRPRKSLEQGFWVAQWSLSI
ncbi:ShlB/FhaC/HecB family hemolysin secretion/activation protein [Pseudomonas maumuensis]|uniref:ShlB/FhaC/HecB family hemolysin secretion/activation protein n=1 Tax=Pseudomonas maumuensis TaxID=2842354 RepID=A0ABX8NNY4_9PSED|nr:ShlB/FhaC/HecB family hemolysin secretion/activation protein [Pseudomonas maumuensis]QXH57711.1 ShlB/FhaC/HecB family hemolysin secretion/activation protein [Pseudomonas maumuensis]